MGYNKIAELTHEMEDVLDLIRKEQLKLNEDIIDTLFKCLDSLEQMINSVGDGESEDVVDVTDLVAKLSAISKGEPVSAASPAKQEQSAGEPAPAGIELTDVDRDVLHQAKEGGLLGIHVRVTLADTCLLKSARSYMVMNALDELGDVIKSVPSAEDLEQEKFDHSFDVLVITASDAKAVEDALNSISEIEKIETEIVDPDAKSAAPEPAAQPKKKKSGAEGGPRSCSQTCSQACGKICGKGSAGQEAASCQPVCPCRYRKAGYAYESDGRAGHQ